MLSYYNTHTNVLYSKQNLYVKLAMRHLLVLLFPMEYVKVLSCHPYCSLFTWMISQWNNLSYRFDKIFYLLQN